MKETVYTLNLSDGFDPVSNSSKINIKFKLDYFPGGEPNFRIDSTLVYSDDTPLYITQRFSSPNDLISILVATDAARRAGFKEIHLILPYFPAARQDRVCNVGESLTIKVFADLINSCKFDSVYIYSPHSEVTPALIDNCKLIERDHKFLRSIISNNGWYLKEEINIVCPDAGAGKRVSKLVKYISDTFTTVGFPLKVNLIRCEKVRDVSTGALKEFFVDATDLGKYPTIICDDIVAYGGTFIGLGKVLKERNCGTLCLFVSHADCDKGLSNMTEFFDQVYTTNSRVNTHTSSKLITFNITI